MSRMVVNHFLICTACNGMGGYPGKSSSDVVCGQCGGTGKVYRHPLGAYSNMFPNGYLKESDKRMLNQLKNLNIERGDLDELVALAAFGRHMEAEYQVFQAEPPDWLTDNLKELRREVRKRLEDTLESRLSEITSRLETLSTVEEKRAKLKEEADRLRGRLNKPAGAAS